jgi:hypothetical protein
MNLTYEHVITKILFFLAGAAPSATGIILAYRRGGKSYWKDFWRRTLDFGRISWKWAVILFGKVAQLVCIQYDTRLLLVHLASAHVLYKGYIPE